MITESQLHIEPRHESVAGLRPLVAVPALPPARLLEDPDEVLRARRLHAAEYRRIGYLTDSALDGDGLVTAVIDPWVPYSRYYGAIALEGAEHCAAPRIVAACRVIGDHAPWPLPTLQLPDVDASVRRGLLARPHGSLGEISALSRHKSVGVAHVRALFRAVWLDSVARGLTDWVLNVDAVVLRLLRAMDPQPFRVVGPANAAPVRPVYPVWVRIAEIQEQIFGRGLAIDHDLAIDHGRSIDLRQPEVRLAEL